MLTYKRGGEVVGGFRKQHSFVIFDNVTLLEGDIQKSCCVYKMSFKCTLSCNGMTLTLANRRYSIIKIKST